MKFWTCSLAAAAALCASTASAEPFQGFQVGAGLGGAKYQSEDKIPGFARKSDDSSKGVAYRAFAGYDTHLSDKVVLGGEVGVSGGGKNISSRVDTARVKVDPGVGFDASVRLGYLVNDNLLLYGRAGYARQSFDREVSFTNSKVVLKSDKTEGGKLFGVGAEYALSDDIALRAEYDRSDFGGDRKRDRVMVSAAYRF